MLRRPLACRSETTRRNPSSRAAIRTSSASSPALVRLAGAERDGQWQAVAVSDEVQAWA